MVALALDAALANTELLLPQKVPARLGSNEPNNIFVPVINIFIHWSVGTLVLCVFLLKTPYLMYVID